MNDDMTRARLAQGIGEPEARAGQPSALAVTLRGALQGAVFPLSAEQVSQVARENDAPAVVLTLLGGLPRRDFSSLDAVLLTLEGPVPGEPASVPER